MLKDQATGPDSSRQFTGSARYQLRFQMTLLVFATFFFTSFMLAIISADTTEDFLIEQAERNTRAVLHQVSRNLEYYITDMEHLAALSNVQNSVIRMLVNDKPIDSNMSHYYTETQNARKILSDISTIRPEISSISIVGQNGSYVDTTNSLFAISQVEPAAIDWYQQVLAWDSDSLFLPPHPITDVYGRINDVISLCQPIYLPNYAAPLGAVCINLNTDTLAELCTNISLEEGGYVFIVDAVGNHIYHPDSLNNIYTRLTQMPQNPIVARVLEGHNSFVQEDRFVTYELISTANYYVIGVLPYSSIVESAKQVRNTQIVLAAIGSLIIALLVALLLSARIFTPLNTLRSLMRKVQRGDFDVRVQNPAANEIGALAEGFNTMIARSQQLMESNLRIEKDKRKAELASLQAQINPHFLYNTLESIVWMANYKPEISAAMAEALAKLFRLMLGGGEDIVPLAQEFEYIEQYLQIQKMRYVSKLDYQIILPPECASVKVPKLILQPLVENAIYHGIKPLGKKGMLRVRAFYDMDDLVLLVEDNGIGMSDQHCQEILTNPQFSSKKMGGIGVSNINERVKMYFPAQYGLRFFSIQGLGTVAMLRLPKGGL